MKVVFLSLRTILLFSSLSIVSGSIFGQGEAPAPKLSPTPQPKPQPNIVGTPEIIINRSTGKGEALIYLRNPDTASLNVSLTGVVSTPTKSKPKITFRRA